MTIRIVFVDDEVNILEGMRRAFHTVADLRARRCPQRGLFPALGADTRRNHLCEHGDPQRRTRRALSVAHRGVHPGYAIAVGNHDAGSAGVGIYLEPCAYRDVQRHPALWGREFASGVPAIRYCAEYSGPDALDWRGLLL